MSARPRIAVVALGASNHATMCGALARAGAEPFACRSSGDLAVAHAIVLPGVANVSFLIGALDAAGMRSPLLEAVERGIPTLGVCAGFQLCFETSDEAPQQRALGILRGSVRPVRAPKLPHMGWNRVDSLVPDFEGGWAYFAHSFAPPSDAADVIAVSVHGEPFASAARRRNVLGVQFHPERSGRFGASILKVFVRDASAPC